MSSSSLMKGLVLSLSIAAAGTMTAAPFALAFPALLHSRVVGINLVSLNVPAETMANRCITMVSPLYPYAAAKAAKPESIVLQAVISKSGRVSPVRLVSGSEQLEGEAMNAVRLWRYKPYMRNGEPVDVTTQIVVQFNPASPGGLVTHPNK